MAYTQENLLSEREVIKMTAEQHRPGNPSEGQRNLNTAPSPINAIEITEQDMGFLRQYIGTDSTRHGEYYLRTTHDGQPTQTELWYLAGYCLGREKGDAVKELQEAYELPEDAASAAWMFTNRYPTTATVLIGRHMPEAAEEYTARVRQVSNPQEELNLLP